MSRVKYKSQLRSPVLLRLFFDFYVMNEVWFRTLGAATYGYPTTKILPYNKERVIDETFKEKVATFKEQIVAALEGSVRKEIRHFNGSTYHHFGVEEDDDGYEIKGTSNRERACRQVGIREHAGQKVLRNLPLESIRILYFTDCWEEDYGGKKWGEATDLLIKLKASNNIKDDVYLIDRILDLQHNTGFILNKTVFATLDDRRVKRRDKKGRTFRVKPLNFRFKATLAEMAENCTRGVQAIYQANLNYI